MLITFSSDELEMCLMCHFVAKNSLEKVDTDHKLIFNAVVKYSLQMQQRSLKALWFVAVSKLGKTDLVFVQPGAKINSVCYCHNVLKQGLLPDIRRSSNYNFLFQQDGAPALLFTPHCRLPALPCARVH